MLRIENYLKGVIDYYEVLIKNMEEKLRESESYDGLALHVKRDGKRSYYYLYSSGDGKHTEGSMPGGTAGKEVSSKLCETAKQREYIGSNDPRIVDIQNRHFAMEILNRLKLSRNLLCELVGKMPSLDHNDVIGGLRPAYRNIPHGKRLKSSDELAWLKKMEERKRLHPNTVPGTKNITPAGLRVRGKGEQMCATLLEEADITFVYECPICIDGQWFYPDFLIYINGVVFIWEHLGMLDKDKYKDNLMEKIEKYSSAGFLPGERLFFTSDDNNFINPAAIESVLMTMINIGNSERYRVNRAVAV